jgi:hypothetical protein
MAGIPCRMITMIRNSISMTEALAETCQRGGQIDTGEYNRDMPKRGADRYGCV